MFLTDFYEYRLLGFQEKTTFRVTSLSYSASTLWEMNHQVKLNQKVNEMKFKHTGNQIQASALINSRASRGPHYPLYCPRVKITLFPSVIIRVSELWALKGKRG